MNQSKLQFVQVAKLGALIMLFSGQVATTASLASGSQYNPVIHFDLPPLKPAVKAVPISGADANKIETWLLGDLSNVILGVGSIFTQRTEIVLAQPNAKLDLAKIAARQDLPPRLRVYAQEMLIEAGQPANSVLVEAYCQAMQSYEGRLYHDVWGVIGTDPGGFGKTLVGYRQAALPCLSHLLDNTDELQYAAGELRAISEMSMHYRVADLAAYYIAQILHIHYNNDSNPVMRDQQIRAIRQQLEASFQGKYETPPSPIRP